LPDFNRQYGRNKRLTGQKYTARVPVFRGAALL